MTEANARSLIPMWSAEHIHDEEQGTEMKMPIRMRVEDQAHRMMKKYGIILAATCIWTICMILCSAIVEHTTERRVREQMAAEYEIRLTQELEAYREEQRQAEQASYFLSGDASREAFLNQEIDAAARLCAKMDTDLQKGGIICNALARVMSRDYPGTMQEVIAQPNQWMFYSADNKFSAHDREIAEKILRDYYESGIIPNGLTDEYVYGSWSEQDYVLRNTWDYSASTRTWRYQG